MYRFPDHNFMLVVLDQLLETGSFVTDLDRLKRLPALQSRLNGESNYGSTIPEMDDFFRGVQLTQDDLEQVTELWFDGGTTFTTLYGRSGAGPMMTLTSSPSTASKDSPIFG
jgi:hypothetical protein